MTMQPPNNTINTTPTDETAGEPPFGANEMRLDARQWLATLSIVMVCLLGIPRLWKRLERFDTGSDYRIPYVLSSDYWLYQRRLEGLGKDASVPVLGDSVIWGEYVKPDGTLTHFLNSESRSSVQFVNCGVNGLFPLSMEGLVASYAGSLHNRKLIVHCNVLWMSSPKADLSSDKEETFNHSTLVPQFSPPIPSYRADTAERLSAIAQRRIEFFAWAGHIDSVYFHQQSIPLWTLEEKDGNPPRSPNAWRSPLAEITLTVPNEPKDDPQRGLASPRHKPWTADGGKPTRFEWVTLKDSLQWSAFQRTLGLLRDRGNDVLVILGPFNSSMVAEEQRPTLHRLQDGIADWLTANKVAYIVPEPLPSDFYADASHPLTQGYALLAQRIRLDPAFQKWLAAK